MHPFEPRRIAFQGLHKINGWQLKLYSVCYGPDPVDWAAFAPGIAMAESTLPLPPITPGRPGVGFLIAHQGRTGNYLVLAWWDRENELPLHVFVSPDRSTTSWRRSEASESVCVWDLEIVWKEREAYVATLLNREGGGVPEYLARVAGTGSVDLLQGGA